MSKRNYSYEILDCKRRQYNSSSFGRQAFMRLAEISDILQNRSIAKSVKKELCRHVPVTLAAILENYFKLAFAKLIDYGEPYLSRSKKLEYPKPDVDTLINLSSKKITAGEFLSHCISFSSLESICSNMSILIQDDFLIAIKSVNINDSDSPKSATLEHKAHEVFDGIKKIIAIRNVYAHEIALKSHRKWSDNFYYWCDCYNFFVSCDALIKKLLI